MYIKLSQFSLAVAFSAITYGQIPGTSGHGILAADDGDPLPDYCDLGPIEISGIKALCFTWAPDAFQIRYAANLTSGDSVINFTNSGANGASLNGPGFGGAAGNMCVNVYAFSPDEQLISCCSCLITPNGLISLSVNNDLVSNTLTGVRPNSVVLKIVTTSAGSDFAGTSCTNSAALAQRVKGFFIPALDTGIRAWGTSVHAAPAGNLAVTETPFSNARLSGAELRSITNRCTNIIGNGSSFGICRSCRVGGLNAIQ